MLLFSIIMFLKHFEGLINSAMILSGETVHLTASESTSYAKNAEHIDINSGVAKPARHIYLPFGICRVKNLVGVSFFAGPLLLHGRS